MGIIGLLLSLVGTIILAFSLRTHEGIEISKDGIESHPVIYKHSIFVIGLVFLGLGFVFQIVNEIIKNPKIKAFFDGLL